MTRFHLIYNSVNKKNVQNKIPEFFKEACITQGIEFVSHDVSHQGTSFTLSDLPELKKGDLLYRCATNRIALTAERMMMNEDVTSFYTDWKSIYKSRISSWFIHFKHGLPVVPTYPGIPSNKNETKLCVENLGGFPIIVKALGGSLGVGVMRFDSMKSLQSALDYFRATKASIMLRKYIRHDYYVRAVVVGNKVIGSKAAYVLEDEFRTNTLDSEKRTRKVKVLTEDLQEKVVQAVHLLGLETGGVDLLFDKNENAYIAEVNFPNDFTTTQRVTGIDIAGEMLAYLIEKSKK